MSAANWSTGDAFPLDEVQDGHASFTDAWVKKYGEPPGSFILRRADGTGRTAVLRPAPAARLDQGLEIAITERLFGTIAKPGQKINTSVKFRSAGFWDRVWYQPLVLLELIVAVLTLLAAVVTGTVTLINGLLRETTLGAPNWLYIVVFVLVCAGAAAKFCYDVRKSSG